ncbi:acyltransferase [Streptomyces sp. ME02-8801-2C]|uniref:acyltransferase family protein n=1 Tax=Streptomyces sp. ME02-8801-2C TaxID=3028680 RepID=UPI0029BE9A8F|nr:acyltransferase [Streptomyces sp. ME02-8801-2C]MDX3456796.1 acyltransferase [Streptomyces sp. ME02-8801-2C]
MTAADQTMAPPHPASPPAARADAEPAGPAVPPAPTPARAGSRLRALDGLRLLAALMVAFYHYAGRGGTISESWNQSPGLMFPTLSQAAVYGCLGVQFFFVISGFVICMSSWGRTVGDFFRSRIARLYPAYWVAIVIITVAAYLLPVVVHPLRTDEVLVNFTMLQQPMGVKRVLGVCWTLWVEVRFYALFALLVVWKGVNYRSVVIFCLLWTLASGIAGVTNDPLVDQIVMPEYSPYFVGGLALFLIHKFGSDLLTWGIVGASFLLGQRYATVELWHPGATGDFHRNPHVIQFLVLLAFVAVAVVALGWLSWMNWRWLTVAGALTYPFYLIHEHLGWFFVRVLHRGLGLDPYLTLAATITSMLVLAYAIHRLVEKPFGPRLKRAMTVQAARFHKV